MRYAHVIRHDIDNQTHVSRLNLLSQPYEHLFVADLGIEAAMISHVIAVQTSRTGHQEGRGVHIGDSQSLQVVEDVTSLLKRKSPIELKPVSGRRRIDGFSLF